MSTGAGDDALETSRDLEKARRAARHADRPGQRCAAPAGTWTVTINQSRCEAKRDCIDVCPNDVFTVRTIEAADRDALSWFTKLRVRAHKNQMAYADAADQCRACGLCVVACPEHAISIAPIATV
jgi:4Fe-4S ferredoxin